MEHSIIYGRQLKKWGRKKARGNAKLCYVHTPKRLFCAERKDVNRHGCSLPAPVFTPPHCCFSLHCKIHLWDEGYKNSIELNCILGGASATCWKGNNYLLILSPTSSCLPFCVQWICFVFFMSAVEWQACRSWESSDQFLRVNLDVKEILRAQMVE